MIKVCFSIVILLFLATYSIGGADCNCPSDISKFKDSAYFNSFYKDFKISCLTDQFIINKEENKAINLIINNLNAAKGSPAEVGNAIKIEISNLHILLKSKKLIV
jgi:hypothetical protein